MIGNVIFTAPCLDVDFDGDESGCAIASLLYENIAEINGGHLLINGYVIAGDLK